MIIDPDDGLTVFEAITLASAASLVLQREADAVLAAGGEKLLAHVREYLRDHPEEMDATEALIRVTREMRVPNE